MSEWKPGDAARDLDGEAMSEPICGRRHIPPGPARAPRDPLFQRLLPARYSPPCVEPAGHTGKHCAEDGTEWEATR